METFINIINDDISVTDMTRLRVLTVLYVNNEKELAKGIFDILEGSDAMQVGKLILGLETKTRKTNLKTLANELKERFRK